ncbi:unnamed protein product [Schistosoma rodhaini]|uniref:Cadherin domain-containing protein n=1 Tax=Schistosoma rodhaini TaxID=6188 RepID=A0AA85G3Z9_9TREM|nr:unnamed protein product [Schistosoma rodhaini]
MLNNSFLVYVVKYQLCRNYMLIILVHRIPKFTQTVFTFETKFSNWINGNLIGRLSLSDENSSLASCGSVQFNIVPGSNYLPVAIDGTTGTLKVIDSVYGTIKNNHNITFQVTVRNANTSLNIFDDATVNILIDGKYSEEETESEITAVKRCLLWIYTIFVRLLQWDKHSK